MSTNSPRTYLTEAVVVASGPGRWPGRRDAAVQKTVKMAVDVLVLFHNKFPQS